MTTTNLNNVNYFKGLVFGPRDSFKPGFVDCLVAGGGPGKRKVYVTLIEPRTNPHTGREYQVGYTEMQVPLGDHGHIEPTFEQQQVIDKFVSYDRNTIGTRYNRRKRTGSVYRGVRSGTIFVRHTVREVGRQNGRFNQSSVPRRPQ